MYHIPTIDAIYELICRKQLMLFIYYLHIDVQIAALQAGSTWRVASIHGHGQHKREEGIMKRS
jgi:hypothetical protein